jgi:hypothetical protein
MNKINYSEQPKTLQNEEMLFITGGNASLPMNSKYKKKDNCYAEASALVERGIVTGMTKQGVAEEIFAHAVAYYNAKDLRNIPFLRDWADDLISHAHVIDIEDGGDTENRKTAYTIIWQTFGDIN